MIKRILSLALLLAICLPLAAQDAVVTETPTEEPKEDLYPMWQNKHAIAINLGLPGFGLEYAYNINRELSIRGGFTAFTFKNFNTDLDVSGQDVNVNANLNSATYDVFLEYQPWTSSAFKLVGGFGYLNNVGINTLVLLNDDIGYGELIIDNEEIGDIDLSVSWTALAPYIGFGWGRAIPKKKVGFGIEIGSYYAGGPDVEIIASGMLANTSEEAAELEENLASYSWVPRAMMRLVIKL
jgi:hypothetical protein